MTIQYTKGIGRDPESGQWKVRVMFKGKRVKRTFKTKKDAERFVDGLRQARNGDEQSLPKSVRSHLKLDVTVGEVVRAYRDAVVNSRKDQSLASRLDRIEQHWNALDLGHLTVEMVCEWARELRQERAASTVKHYLDDLHGAIEAGKVMGTVHASHTSPVPAARAALRSRIGNVQVVGQGRRIERRVSDRELAKVLAVADPTFGRLIRAAVASSFRSGELAALSWGDVDFKTHTVQLLNQKQKGQAPTKRRAPMTPELEQVLREQRGKVVRHRDEPVFPSVRKSASSARGGHMDANTVSTRWTRLRAQVSLDDVRFHDLRHEALSRLGEQGLSATQLQAFSGHSSVAMLDRYCHTDAATIASLLYGKAPTRRRA